MTALFRLVDVDYAQWKAVTRTLLRTDFRLPLVESGGGAGRVAGAISTFLFLSMFGLGAAVFVFVSRDVLLTGTLALSYLTVMLITTLLTQHGVTLLSTTDYAILAPRPVSSRTFLAIRVTNVLFHALATTAMMGYPVVIAYALAHEMSVTRGLAGAIAMLAWSITVALAMVASYGAALQRLGAGALNRGVGYLQLIAGFIACGGLLASSRLLGQSALRTATVPDTWWLVLLPPAWFASYLELVTGMTNSTTLLRAAMSVIAVIALIAPLRGKLGVEYARRLSEIGSNEHSTATTARTPFFRDAEARAAALLVLAHFKNDLRVRLGVLGIVPLIALNVLIDVDGPFDLIALAILLFPALLTQHLASSDAYAASWIYDTTPVDRARLIIATRNVAVVYFILPFLVLVAGVYAWRFDDVAHAMTHTALLGMLSYIALQGSTVLTPRLPFALPPSKLRGEATLFAWMVVVIFGGQAAVFVLERYVYLTAARTAVAFGVLLVVILLLNRAIRWRVQRRYSQPTR